MTEKQKHLLKLFREIDEICKEHDLRYVMAGGTLIGVWRHEGFVPWDDDVDIYMPRADWEKFVEICKRELPPERAIQCSDVDRRYSNSFPRYASTDTCAVHRHQIIADDLAGEIIDVLTLDPIPADDKEYEKYRTHLMIYSELINPAVPYGARFEVPASLYLKYLLSYVFLGKDRTLKKLEKIMFSYNEDECDRYAMRWGGCPFLFDKDMMFPVKYGDFEGEKVMIPQRTSDYLIWHYGDEWSYIPPHGEREAHEAIEVDGATFKELRADYMPNISKGRIRRESVLRKFRTLLNAKRTHRLLLKGREIKGRTEVMDLTARISESGRDLKEMVEQREFAALNDIFENYYRIQLSADFIGREDYANIHPFYYPVLLDVKDDVFWASMMTLFYTERISKAYRMLQIREKLSSVTPEMKALMADVELFRKAVRHYELRELEEAEAIAADLLERYPENPSFLKFRVRFLMIRAAENRLEAERFLENALRLFPEDGYFLKYKADLLWMSGSCQDALVLYADAREKTNNGIVWLEMDRLFKECRQGVLDTCENLLECKAKEDAEQLMELWMRLMPEDEDIKAAMCLVKAYRVHTQKGLEGVIKEALTNIEKPMTNSLKEKEEDTEKELLPGSIYYKKALVKAWKRLGYTKELAEFHTAIKCTGEESELEWLSEEIRTYQISNKDRLGETYKLLGDIRMKQGQTKAAFENYRKALDFVQVNYVRKEIARVIFTDLSQGSKRAAVYAKKSDATEFMDNWLGKYGTIEDISALVQKLI